MVVEYVVKVRMSLRHGVTMSPKKKKADRNGKTKIAAWTMAVITPCWTRPLMKPESRAGCGVRQISGRRQMFRLLCVGHTVGRSIWWALL